MFRGYKYIAFEIALMTDLSLAECREQCEIQKTATTSRHCYSFDYNPSAKLCSLNSNDENIAYETQRVQDEEWNHYDFSKNKYTIIRYFVL